MIRATVKALKSSRIYLTARPFVSKTFDTTSSPNLDNVLTEEYFKAEKNSEFMKNLNLHSQQAKNQSNMVNEKDEKHNYFWSFM